MLAYRIGRIQMKRMWLNVVLFTTLGEDEGVLLIRAIKGDQKHIITTHYTQTMFNKCR